MGRLWRVVMLGLCMGCGNGGPRTVYVDTSMPVEDIEAINVGASWWGGFEVVGVTREDALQRAEANELGTVTFVGIRDYVCPWTDHAPGYAAITHTEPGHGAIVCWNVQDRLGDPRVAAHELGHALGLRHSANREDLMFIDALAWGVQPGDWMQLHGGYPGL